MVPVAYLLSHMKLAPIQINTWGHSQTSGVSTIDYYLSSEYFERSSEQSRAFYSETCIAMKSLSTYYYHPKDSIHYVSNLYTRKLLGLPQNKTIYSCFQVFFKFEKLLVAAMQFV